MDSEKSDGESDFTSIDTNPSTSNSSANLDSTIKENLHNIPLDAFAQTLETDLKKGLSRKEAELRLERDGLNTIAPPTPKYFGKIMGYLFGGFCWILWIASFVIFLSWEPLGQPPQVANLALAIVLLVVISFQALFTAYQDYSSSRVMKSILKMMPHFVNVFRDGEKFQIPAIQLVKGDLVEIKTGNKIGADIRLIEVSGLKIDKSILTGESVPVTGNTEATDSFLFDSANVALMGTTVVEGTALGVVIHVANDSLMGKVAKLSQKSHMKQTTLQKEIFHFTTIIAGCAITTAVACMILWAAWLEFSYPDFLNLSNMLSTDMGIIVAYVPEGFPIASTLGLSLIAKGMAKKNILVKSLSIMETLGCVNVVCSDKTGTLTTNKMSVVKYSLFSKVQNVKSRTGAAEPNQEKTILHSISYFCNAATFEIEDLKLPISARRILGDSTDGALLRFAGAVDEKIANEKDSFELQHTIPFNSKTKYMATVYLPKGEIAKTGFWGNGPSPVLLVKGAPEMLYDHCNRYLDPVTNGILPFGTQEREEIEKMQESWSQDGLRVLLLSYRVSDEAEVVSMTTSEAPNANDFVSDLVFVGLVGIIDPPREETAEVIATCREAGCRFFMVTGDFPITAASIAKSVGIFKSNTIHTASDLMPQPRPLEFQDPVIRKPRFNFDKWWKRQKLNFRAWWFRLRGKEFIPVETEKRLYKFVKPEKRRFKETGLLLTGSDLEKLEEHHWDLIDHYDEVVFARTTPDQKYKIVKELQARRNVVAVTGDGVNDAPALKNAHIGIAMGSGSDAAMEASAMILVDSNFSSIVLGLEQGRIVFENLKKVSLYLMPGGCFAELVPVLVNLFLGVPAPLSSFEMIFISCVTDICPALSLMYEKGETNLLKKKPRRIGKDHLVNWKLMFHCYLFMGMCIAIMAHIMFFLYMYLEWNIVPSTLFLAFNKWGVDGYAGLSLADQINANNGGQTVYFITVVEMQIFGNLMSTRTRYVSIFQQPPYRNPRIFGAWCISLSCAAIIMYVPFFNNIIGTYPIPAQYWFIPLPGALIIIVADECRKGIVRNRPNSWIAKAAW